MKDKKLLNSAALIMWATGADYIDTDSLYGKVSITQILNERYGKVSITQILNERYGLALNKNRKFRKKEGDTCENLEN